MTATDQCKCATIAACTSCRRPFDSYSSSVIAIVVNAAGGTAERNNRISEARAAAYDRAALKSKNAMQAAADAIAAVDQPVDDEQISDTDTDDEMQGRCDIYSCSHITDICF